MVINDTGHRVPPISRRQAGGKPGLRHRQRQRGPAR